MANESERARIMAIRRGDFLTPLAPLDGELIRAFPGGKPLRVEIAQPRRSGKQNRLYWSLLRLVADNLDQDVTKDALHEWFKLRLGITHDIILRSGEVNTVAGSTAFDNMEHAEFTAYMQRVKDLIVTQLIPRVNGDAMEREARLMLGEAA